MIVWKAVQMKNKKGKKGLKTQSSQSVRKLSCNPNPIILKRNDIIPKSKSPETRVDNEYYMDKNGNSNGKNKRNETATTRPRSALLTRSEIDY